ncbi:MAG: hypothetical protein RIS64_1772 [Bacteroidota bacterium]|jgi:hypothetical protein
MKITFSTIILSGSILLSGCGSSLRLTDAAQIVPKESQRVTRIDLKKINGKLDKKTIQAFPLYKTLRQELGMNKGKKNAFSTILLDGTRSGVDFNQHGYWVQDNGYTHFYFLLSNPADFTKMMREGSANQKINKTKGVQFVGNDTFMVAWTGNVGVVSTQLGSGSMSKALNKMSKKVPYDVAPTESKAAKKAPLDPVAFFNISPTRSVLTDPNFQKAILGNHDMASYYKWGQSFQNQMSSISGMGDVFGQSSLNDLTMTSYTDFSNGRMTSHVDYQVPDSLKKQLNQFFKPRVNTDFSRYLNHPNNIVNFAISLNTNGLLAKMGDYDNLLPLPDSTKAMFKEAFKSMNGDILFSIRMDTAGIHPILVMPSQQKTVVEKTLKQMLANKQLTIDSMGVYTLVKKTDTLKAMFPNVAPPTGMNKPAPIPTESTDSQEVTHEDSMSNDTLKVPQLDALDKDKTHLDGDNDNEMPPPSADMPAPNPLKGKGGFKMNRLMWQNDMLIMTDSISIEIMRKTPEKAYTATESTTELAKSAFGFHLNLDAAMNSGYPAIMLVRMMVPELPMTNLRMNFKDGMSETVITTAKNGENVLMTWLGFVNQIGGFLGGMLKGKDAPPAEQYDDEKK